MEPGRQVRGLEQEGAKAGAEQAAVRDRVRVKDKVRARAKVKDKVRARAKDKVRVGVRDASRVNSTNSCKTKERMDFHAGF